MEVPVSSALQGAEGAMASLPDVLEAEVEEHELTRFEHADECLAILNGDDLYWPSRRREDTTEGNGEAAGATLAGQSAVNKSLGPAGAQRAGASRAEIALKRLTKMLDEYQDQDNLLDPYLESLVNPPVAFLQERIARAYEKGPSTDTAAASDLATVGRSADVQRAAFVIYYFVKIRGYKTIMNYFPHGVDDLLPTLAFLEQCCDGRIETSWESRYVIMLWAALICMIPFDLARFDTNSASAGTAVMPRLIAVGKHFLSAAGKERDAAAILLSRIFQRRDADGDPMKDFLLWCVHKLTAEPACTIFESAGIHQTVCEIVRLGTPDTLRGYVPLLQVIFMPTTGQSDHPEATLTGSSLIDKYKCKLASRVGALVMDAFYLIDAREENEHVHEETKKYMTMLRHFLKSKDTAVRYSAAKGLARLSRNLELISRSRDDALYDSDDEPIDPEHWLHNIYLRAFVIEEMLQFEIDVDGPMDLADEYTWQGFCLALAELARKNLLPMPCDCLWRLPDDSNGQEIYAKFIKRALHFDVRRGAHSVGSGVRDAACYLLWCVARTKNKSASKYADDLVCLALFDRETSVRRAASATLQECVGREGDVPEGIDIIGKTDFYAVGNRRNAFLNCAPAVAQHKRYREVIVEHLITACLPHWDSNIRQLAAETLARVARIDLEHLGQRLVLRLSEQCQSRNQFVLHGALLSLAELGLAFKESKAHLCVTMREDAFRSLSNVVAPPVRAPTTGPVLQAACRLIASSISSNSASRAPWVTFIDLAMQRQDDEVHDAVALAFRAASRVTDTSARAIKLLSDWPQLNTAQRRAVIKVLGAIDYSTTPSILPLVLPFLIEAVGLHNSSYINDVEVRQYAYEAMANSICSLKLPSPDVEDGMLNRVVESLLSGMDDYSNDARGDVGSWVRKASMQSMRQLLLHIESCHSRLTAAVPVDESILNRIFAAVAKQIAERMESLRGEALQTLLTVAHAFGSRYPQYTTQIASSILKIFPDGVNTYLMNYNLLYSRYIHLLFLQPLRGQVLRGIVTGISPQRETINRQLSDGLCSVLRGPERLEIGDTQSIIAAFVVDLTNLTMTSIRSNRYFPPCLQTFNVIIEDGVLADAQPAQIISLGRVLRAANASIDKVKSVPRIFAALQFTMNALAFPSLQQSALELCRAYLVHPFPTIRASAAEALFLAAQEHLVETYSGDVDDLLLSTPWSEEDMAEHGLREKAEAIVATLKQQAKI